MKTDQKDKNLKEELKNTRENNRFLVKELEKSKNHKEWEKFLSKPKEEKLFTFTCAICDQNKQHQKLHQVRINGIGYDPKKIQKICDFCINRVDVIREEEEEDFF